MSSVRQPSRQASAAACRHASCLASILGEGASSSASIAATCASIVASCSVCSGEGARAIGAQSARLPSIGSSVVLLKNAKSS